MSVFRDMALDAGYRGEAPVSIAGRDDGLERLQLRAALIAMMRSLESSAARLEALGMHREAATARADAEIAQAALDGPAAVDALWKRRQSGLKAVA